MKRGWIMAAVAAAFLAGSLGAMTNAGATVAKKAVELVREQNVDDNGYIRVHEQGTAKVNVTNATLPVSGSVNVANTPTVKLDPSGTMPVEGTVAIGNTPTVSVGNTPTVSVGNTPTVSVGNTPTVRIDAAANAVKVATSAAEPLHVQSSGSTVLLPGFSPDFIDLPGDGSIKHLNLGVDMRPYEKLRVAATNGGPGSATVVLIHRTLAGAFVTRLDTIALGPGESFSKSYDVPGESIAFSTTSTGGPSRLWILAYGR